MGTALGYTIRELRKEKGISQRELANEMELGPTAIYNYENGNRSPDADTILRLAKFFGVSSDYLLGIAPSRSPFNWAETEKKSDRISETLKAIRSDIRTKFLPALEAFLDAGTDTESSAAVLNRLSNIMILLVHVKSIYVNSLGDYTLSSNPESDLIYSNRLNADLADICLDILSEVSGLRKELCRLFARDMKVIQAQRELMEHGDTIPRFQPTEEDDQAAEE